ncbi:hypothetical protein RHI9324_04890 [Rhizobium sp. CECT 9324]|nr:hypothetical protein RHI9324_04890 [Rhizobium sp. CECT 9324]
MGLGLDATCSLVVLGEGGYPLAVGPSEEAERDILVWMDHRAVDQAERINTMGHDVLRYVDGRISRSRPLSLALKQGPERFTSPNRRLT